MVTLGASNPSSVDAEANWLVKSNNQSLPEFSDEKTFIVPRRATALASFNVYMFEANLTLTPSDLRIVESYKISLFNFQKEEVGTGLSNCSLGK